MPGRPRTSTAPDPTATKETPAMYRHTLPDNDAWIARFKDLRAWVETHGRLPKNDPEGGPEDTLRNWLERQREAMVDGQLEGNLEKILRTVPGAAAAPTRPRTVHAVPEGGNRVERLESFYRRNGRLPRHSAMLPGEKTLYRYLIEIVRAQHEKGELDPEIHERLSKIPGVFPSRVKAEASLEPPLRRRGNTPERLEALVSFCVSKGRLPRATGGAAERSLYNFLRRTVRPEYQAGKLDEQTIRRLECVPSALKPRLRSLDAEHTGTARAA